VADVRPDLLMTWPTSCDYPLWRAWLCRERDRFARVIIAFSYHPGPTDFRPFVTDRLEDRGVEFFTAPLDGEWRDAATNACLDRSDAEWVWFTEQDLEIHDNFFWRVVHRVEAHGAGMIGIRRDGRWHPSCLFARRDRVEATTRYFGPDPMDHFYRFGQELAATGVPRADLDDWFQGRGIYTHLAGLSRNHEIIDAGLTQPEELYHPEELAPYLRRCLAEPDLHEGWVGRARSFLDWYAVSS
jgi:hypothetical protein